MKLEMSGSSTRQAPRTPVLEGTHSGPVSNRPTAGGGLAAARMKLSVIVPVFNERATVEELLERVDRVPLAKEIVVVDDASTDGTRELLRAFEGRSGFTVRYHERNRGKGRAIRTGLEAVTGEVVVIQDADLEYDPREYPQLIRPIVEGEADVVYGSRFLGSPRGHRVLYFWHSVGNRMLTTLSNAFSDLNLTDMETCYKVMVRDIAARLDLQSKDFGIEPEITLKVARMRARIYEVPISYHGRTYEEGKKIGLKDGFKAVYTILRFWRWQP